ncbi:MAG: membrane protein insertion efficiency factor YidD [Pseudomonadota bacterium]|nr:membrane protein insertion efficiency factor YidD [Pseudomonadota bacterium]
MNQTPRTPSWVQRVLVGSVRAYRLLLSPWLGSSCRFEPSCSAYALEVLDAHGAAIGSYLTVTRLLRCHPWCAGGHDPVPATPRLFSFLVHPASDPEKTARSSTSVLTEKTPS